MKNKVSYRLFPIAWHEECLENDKAHLARKEAGLVRIQKEVEELHTQLAAYASQIEEAVRRGITEFGCDRFGKRRTKE